ncbi:hypothetical protein FSP39_019554 [Pinctada imbricata]|uniref:Uncharacterized protein n=1 Tax=Pinctada imbricata TaxID=66713 RepID=A0AA88XTD8_PINIB|nr:hypothetical protein FSP39_019554 [Pinctada imbricata]
MMISLKDDINIIIAYRERDIRRLDIVDTQEDLEMEKRHASSLILALENLKLADSRCLSHYENVTLREKKILRDSGVDSMTGNEDNRDSEGIQETSPPSDTYSKSSNLLSGSPSEHQEDDLQNCGGLPEETQHLLERQGNASESRRKQKVRSTKSL